ADPRVTHSLTLEVDEFGDVLESASITYGRRHASRDTLLREDDRERQGRTWITFEENRYTNAVLEDDAYRVPGPCETRSYELVNALPAGREPGATSLFRFDELRRALRKAGDGG